MEVLLDEAIDETDNKKIIYGTIGPRFLATLIDGIVIIILNIPLYISTYLSWDYYSLSIVMAIVGMIYNPLMEYLYGATLGKRAMKLKVVNHNYEKVNLLNVILRNCFIITNCLISILLIIQPTFFSDLYSTIASNEVSLFSNGEYLFVKFFSSYLYLFIVVIDGIVLISDKRSQSLHDKLAKTYVIKT